MSMFSIASAKLQSGPRDGGRERIEIDHQQVDRLDAVRAHDLIVGAAPAEQAAVHARMQRLEAAVHQLGKAGVVRHFAHRQAGIEQQPRGAAGGQQLDAAPMQPGGKLPPVRACPRPTAAPAGWPPTSEAAIPGRAAFTRDRPSSRSFLRSVPRLMPRITAARLWLPAA